MSEIDDPEKIKRRESRDVLLRRKQLEDIRVILSDARGRRFYWRLLVECGIFKSSFTGNNTTFFNEGRRDVGLVLLADLNEADPSAYLVMLDESKLEATQNG